MTTTEFTGDTGEKTGLYFSGWKLIGFVALYGLSIASSILSGLVLHDLWA